MYDNDHLAQVVQCALISHVTHSAEVWGSILTLHTLFCGTLCKTIFQKCKYLPLNQFEYGLSGPLGQLGQFSDSSRSLSFQVESTQMRGGIVKY
jgi:hypothetical protein